MGKTSIEWTDASWNPVVGCTEVSPGCANCYAARLAGARLKNHPDYNGLVIPGTQRNSIESAKRGPRRLARWSGQVRFLPHRLEEPLCWRRPRRIFVCDMGDLFHESVPDEFLASVFRVMSRARHHTFQVLTKRAARMKQFVSSVKQWQGFHTHNGEPPEGYGGHGQILGSQWPLPNVWLGVSVENQHFADERIPLLSETPAAVRFLSCEPLLGSLNLQWFSGIHWVIAGGESGAGARPMHPDWARGLRDQCRAARVPFFFKQWGEYIYDFQMEHPSTVTAPSSCFKVGKKKAGRLLDGREWNEFPAVP